MKNYKLAWRNLWRNRRRTLITAASIFFAVFFALFMRSLMLGSYDYMYKNVIESYSGYIQVQQQDWWDEKTIDNSIAFTSELEATLLENENVEAVIPRLESFALASSGKSTKGVMVLGIDPEKESLLSDIANKVVKYKLSPAVIGKIKSDDRFSEETKEVAELFENSCYNSDERLLLDLAIKPEEAQTYIPILENLAHMDGKSIEIGVPGVWLGEKLANHLELSTGDTLVLLGQGYHGTTAAGKYVIAGLIRLPAPEISSRVVYMPYDIAQKLYNSGDKLTSMVMHLKEKEDKDIEECMVDLQSKLEEGLRVIDWREMNEVTVQQMEADNVSGQFMIGILYVVISFGIIGTVLMMTAERRREFGVLVAIGMQKKKLASIISYEMLYIGLIGLLAGMVICVPLILYGVGHPFTFKGELAHMMEEYDFEPMLVFQPISFYFISQSLIVGFMVLISLIHPLRKIRSLKVVNALRA